jgi:hypothetical protein
MLKQSSTDNCTSGTDEKGGVLYLQHLFVIHFMHTRPTVLCLPMLPYKAAMLHAFVSGLTLYIATAAFLLVVLHIKSVNTFDVHYISVRVCCNVARQGHACNFQIRSLLNKTSLYM